MQEIPITKDEMLSFCKENVSSHVFTFSKIGENFSIKKCSPQELIFQTDRFDLMVKLSLAYSLKYHLNAKWFNELYIQHILYFNNFHEANFPKRKEGTDFLLDFLRLYSIYNNNTSRELRTIPINCKQNLIDGAHRLALATVNNDSVYTVMLDNRFPSTHYCFDYGFFVRKGLPYVYSDYIASSYCKMCHDAFMIVLFPRCKDKWNIIHEILKQEVDIFYQRDIQLTRDGINGFIRLLYHNEKWLDESSNEITGVEYKASECFTLDSNIRTYIVYAKDINNVVKVKKRIRTLCQVGNHSIHSTDSYEDTVRVSEVIFNEINRKLLNMPLSLCDSFNTFNLLFNKFKDYIASSKLNKEMFCIDGSSVLSVLGLRDCYDLDFLYAGSSELINLPNKVECHNDYFIKCHFEQFLGVGIHEIIFNPKYYFYYNGIKIMSPEVLLQIKKKRNEDKDKVDVQLIQSYLFKKEIANQSIADANNCDPNWYSILDSIIEHNNATTKLPRLFLNARFAMSNKIIHQINDWILFVGSTNHFYYQKYYYIFDFFKEFSIDTVRSYYRDVILMNVDFFKEMNDDCYLLMWVCLFFYMKKFETYTSFLTVYSGWLNT